MKRDRERDGYAVHGRVIREIVPGEVLLKRLRMIRIRMERER